MDRLFVLRTSGSFVETEDGIEKDVVALHFAVVTGPDADVSELALVVAFDEAATLTYGLHRMFVELGRGEEFRQAIARTKTRHFNSSD